MPTPDSAGPQAVTIRHLFSDTLVYGVAGVANRAIGFLLLPITTAILDPDDYGVLGLFGATASILWLLVSAGVPSAFFRFYAESKDAPRRAALRRFRLAAVPAAIGRGAVDHHPARPAHVPNTCSGYRRSGRRLC